MTISTKSRHVHCQGEKPEKTLVEEAKIEGIQMGKQKKGGKNNASN